MLLWGDNLVLQNPGEACQWGEEEAGRQRHLSECTALLWPQLELANPFLFCTLEALHDQLIQNLYYTTCFMSFLVCSCLFFFFLFHAHDVHVFRRRSSSRMISSSPVWWPVAWRFPYPWIACHATSLCSFRSSNWHRTTSGGCAFSSKLVSSQVCFNHLQVLQVNQPQINSVRSNEKERMSKPVNFFSELPLRRTHRRANVKT